MVKALHPQPTRLAKPHVVIIQATAVSIRTQAAGPMKTTGVQPMALHWQKLSISGSFAESSDLHYFPDPFS